MIPSFFHRVAQRILTLHAQDVPDLRAATILLPNYHAAQPLVKAMGEVAGCALLLPQMVTLTDWAQSVQLESPIQPDTRRIAVLYQALREREWFGDADLWSLSRELLALMDELTRHHVALPESETEFAEQLVSAYRARSGQALQFEAKVVHELWFAMTSGEALDAVSAYQQRLARLVSSVEGPLYVLQTCELAAPERRFLDACRERVPVEVFDVRDMVRDAPDCALLTRALQRDASSADLKSDAESLQPDAMLNSRLKLFAAHGLEQEAQAADVQVRRWLLEGKQSIAVVVQDRLVARRARALLERAGVMVRDETGWTMATLSVSTVLMRWLEAVQGEFYYQDLLDLLKSPFLFADQPPAERKQAAYLFEQLVRKHGAVAQLESFIELAEREQRELVQPLVRLRQAAQALSRKTASIAEWLGALHDSLEILGVSSGWAQDAAGQQLAHSLTQWAEELGEDGTRCSFAEWRRWLAQQLDLNTFRDLAVESPVLFTHLAATRWRSFDALLLLGCDAMHLPAPANAGQWFNDAVRASLGLPMSSVQQTQVRDDLLAILALNGTVLASWQASKNGEPNLLSPHLEMLRALHLLAYRDDLSAHELGEMLNAARVQSEAFALPPVGTMPRPAVRPALFPGHISPSGYNSLVACPYQFHARKLLRLNELDEVREELDKRDYGTWVHAALQRFHDEFKLLMEHEREQIEAGLRRISTEVFAEALAHDYLAEAWLLRWQAQIPAYLDWQLANEHAGWRYSGAEVPFEIGVADGLILRGRIDRIDVHSEDAENLRVLDYKTQAILPLKHKLKEAGEDVQLACYVYDLHAGEAAFVALDGAKVDAVPPPHDIAELAQLNIDRLRGIFERMQQGAAMPAHGAERACSYCEMRGLCRHGAWEAESISPRGKGGLDNG